MIKRVHLNISLGTIIYIDIGIVPLSIKLSQLNG